MSIMKANANRATNDGAGVMPEPALEIAVDIASPEWAVLGDAETIAERALAAAYGALDCTYVGLLKHIGATVCDASVELQQPSENGGFHIH